MAPQWMGILTGFLIASALAIFGLGIGYAIIIGIVSSLILFLLVFRKYDITD
jgi:hypothetical protein